ncbi:Mad3/BUB1 homology region 1-domain-containing protein [Pyronema omphalodes]|nr:Mad3/BUB1 homology region 1-domain-containing protein [Pyronema omphalodes]
MDSVDFDLIEGHKENIQPIRTGRSARALAEKLTPLSQNPHLVRSEHSARQQEWEEELKTAHKLDDPLQVWLNYIKWTIETFPSGHSAESGLLNLLERATREFTTDTRYISDIRYLRLWIQYAQDFSDSPREVFAYLARNNIGQDLATYYEEFAALLELHGKRNAAAEIYQTGIEKNAMPVERLERKYQEFLQRLEANPIGTDEPTSPALPAVRPALSVKPFGGLGSSAGLGAPATQQQQRQPQSTSTRPKKQMMVFSDADPQPSKPTEKPTGGWDNIGTLQQRKKENTVEPRKWAGETLKNRGKASGGEKLMVFRDS